MNFMIILRNVLIAALSVSAFIAHATCAGGRTQGMPGEVCFMPFNNCYIDLAIDYISDFGKEWIDLKIVYEPLYTFLIIYSIALQCYFFYLFVMYMLLCGLYIISKIFSMISHFFDQLFPNPEFAILEKVKEKEGGQKQVAQVNMTGGKTDKKEKKNKNWQQKKEKKAKKEKQASGGNDSLDKKSSGDKFLHMGVSFDKIQAQKKKYQPNKEVSIVQNNRSKFELRQEKQADSMLLQIYKSQNEGSIIFKDQMETRMDGSFIRSHSKEIKWKK